MKHSLVLATAIALAAGTPALAQGVPNEHTPDDLPVEVTIDVIHDLDDVEGTITIENARSGNTVILEIPHGDGPDEHADDNATDDDNSDDGAGNADEHADGDDDHVPDDPGDDPGIEGDDDMIPEFPGGEGDDMSPEGVPDVDEMDDIDLPDDTDDIDLPDAPAVDDE